MLALLVFSFFACTRDSDVKDDTGPIGTGPADTGWDPRFDALVDAVLADLEASSAPGVSVAVLEDGRVTFARAFGSGHPDNDVTITTDTLFQIGSDTKKQTAVGLLQKVEQGLVSLDDTLAQALPELEFRWGEQWNDQVALEHLLSHQGAFYDYAIWETGEDDDLLASWTYGEFADSWFLMNPPGEFWNYSNPNFSLAGLITEELDTRAWPDIMVEDVYRPLGMDRTYLRKSEVIADGDYAVGYGLSPVSYQYETREMDSIADHAWTRPAGLAWSTASQQVLFADFLMSGNADVLGDTHVQAMHDEHVNTLYLYDEMHYGHGLMVNHGFEVGDDYYEVPVWTHGGNTLAFTSAFWVLPEHGFAISILSSGYGTDFTDSVYTAMTTLVDDLPAPVEPVEYTIDTSRYTYHVGDYVDEWNVGEATVGLSGDTLTISMPTLEQYGYTVDDELYSVSSDIHYVNIDGSYYDLTFIQAEDGEPTEYLRNRSFVLTRAEGGQALQGADRTPTKADVERWMERARVMEPLPDAMRAR